MAAFVVGATAIVGAARAALAGVVVAEIVAAERDVHALARHATEAVSAVAAAPTAAVVPASHRVASHRVAHALVAALATPAVAAAPAAAVGSAVIAFTARRAAGPVDAARVRPATAIGHAARAGLAGRRLAHAVPTLVEGDASFGDATEARFAPPTAATAAVIAARLAQARGDAHAGATVEADLTVRAVPARPATPVRSACLGTRGSVTRRRAAQPGQAELAGEARAVGLAGVAPLSEAIVALPVAAERHVHALVGHALEGAFAPAAAPPASVVPARLVEAVRHAVAGPLVQADLVVRAASARAAAAVRAALLVLAGRLATADALRARPAGLIAARRPLGCRIVGAARRGVASIDRTRIPVATLHRWPRAGPVGAADVWPGARVAVVAGLAFDLASRIGGVAATYVRIRSDVGVGDRASVGDLRAVSPLPCVARRCRTHLGVGPDPDALLVRRLYRRRVRTPCASEHHQRQRNPSQAALHDSPPPLTRWRAGCPPPSPRVRDHVPRHTPAFHGRQDSAEHDPSMKTVSERRVGCNERNVPVCNLSR